MGLRTLFTAYELTTLLPLSFGNVTVTSSDVSCVVLHLLISKMKATTNDKQLEILVDYLQSHHDMVVGYANSSDAKTNRQEMWIRLSDKLNRLGPPVRNCLEWKSIWTYYKYNLKRKLAADVNLEKRKNCDKRYPFTPTELIVIDVLGLKDKLGTLNKRRKKDNPSLREDVSDSLRENTSSFPYNTARSDIEIDDNKEGIIISNEHDSKAMFIETIEPSTIPTQHEPVQPSEYDGNASQMLNDTLMAMQQTQQAVLKELAESNRRKRNSLELKERLLQLEQEKLEEQKLQNYEENKQVYIKIELKRQELEMYELKLKERCTQCTVKHETEQ